jgi:predicted sulfurtransferase
MQIILSLLLTLTLAFSMLQCQKSATTGKSDAAKNNRNVSAATPAPTAANTHAEEHSDDAPRISLEDAKKAFDEGNVLIIDTRAEVAYKTEHIKGAINIPADEFQTRYKEVPKNKKVIAYCS